MPIIAKSSIDDEPWTERRVKSEISLCAKPCGEAAFVSLVLGTFTFPYLIKRGLGKYLQFEYRFFLSAISTITFVFCMSSFARDRCEKRIRKSYNDYMNEKLKLQEHPKKSE